MRLSVSLTPRQLMQLWAASIMTARPRGFVFSSKRSASCTAASSWICGRFSTHSESLAYFEIPITRSPGTIPTQQRPRIGAK